MPIEPIVDGVIDLIKKNMVARTNVTSDVTTGANVISVENSMHFSANQEIVLIDYGYNDPNSSHYQIFEYAKIKTVSNTRSIILTNNVQGNWTVANGTFIQKTIGHSPLYDDQIYYGDREVIPTDLMALTVEPVSMSNDWIYLQGGLDEEYTLKITIYGKSVDTEEGRRILDRYSDNVTQLLNENMHLQVNTYETPIMFNVNIGDTQIIIEDTPDNRENIVLTNVLIPMLKTMKLSYQLQDNLGVSLWMEITNITYSGGLMYLTISPASDRNFVLSEYAILKKIGAYIYDSRASAATYGVVSKGSAILRASEINWYAKQVNEFSFPQRSLSVNTFTEIDESSSSS
jgi:hypothetical protein